MRFASQIILGLLAVVALAYLVLTGIGWFAFPFALLAWATFAIRRSRQSPPDSTPRTT